VHDPKAKEIPRGKDEACGYCGDTGPLVDLGCHGRGWPECAGCGAV
jgi:hypothetical protein